MNGVKNSSVSSNMSPMMEEALRLMKDRQEAAAVLNNLLQKEMNDHKLASSYQDFRVRYLRALGYLRPASYEEKDDLDESEQRDFMINLRREEKKKKMRYDQLEQAWQFYDSVAIDKPDVLTAEDQKMEAQLDEIEEDINEEWQDFVEEVIASAEEAGEGDTPEINEWRLETKDLKKDLELIRRRRQARDEMRKKAEVRRIEEIVRARRGEDSSEHMSSVDGDSVDMSKSGRGLRKGKSHKGRKSSKDERDAEKRKGKRDKKKQSEDENEGKLLEEVFPPHIAKALREGRKVEPESKEIVTIFFSDIVGFTNISSSISPLKVSQMLDRLYQKFDKLSHDHDVYKGKRKLYFYSPWLSQTSSSLCQFLSQLQWRRLVTGMLGFHAIQKVLF